jgi:RNA polymerase sigma-70 factor (ECF subfamily)
VRNACLDEIRHRNVVREHEAHVFSYDRQEDIDTENYILYSDLHRHLMEALRKVPDKLREAFEMNRFEGLKYKEIAEKLNVSERTVEVRIGKTLELLRTYLKDFLHKHTT